ncbi:MAG TPA: glycoside hydrolase family 15 protein [Pyrinomonadaceae bacterium]|nr:glycoside hydrolase family 15 protein [Pyrinomonadaceae bacterium]
MIRIGLVIVIAAHTVIAQGADAHWPRAAKTGFGTSTTLNSKVWFTLANGVMTEVFYPTLDTPNVQTLQLLFDVDGKMRSELGDLKQSSTHTVAGTLTFLQHTGSLSEELLVQKTFVTDPQRNTVLINFEVFSLMPRLRLFVYYDPSLNNSGMHDSAWAERDALLSVDGNVASALMSSCGLFEPKNGLLGGSFGKGRIKGNVVQIAELRATKCTLALGFGETPSQAKQAARLSLGRGFDLVRQHYEAGWKAYTATLPYDHDYPGQVTMAAMVLKALEDKTFRGASIASPSVPWGGGPNANEATVTGYHGVWARDLYHVATAFDTIGDRETARRLLDYLFRVQQKPDGSFPQNSHVDGRPIGNALQMDQVGLPLVLAYQLERSDRQTWLKHIKPAADFIVRHGPRTEHDRWEEEAGYSPATIAAQIAGLVCAAEIARTNGDQLSAETYLMTADTWASNVEKWTVTTTGFRSRPYYLRITANADPNDGAKMEINSSSLEIDERNIIDAGFLELVRLGIKDPNDELIKSSLALVDEMIRVATPSGAAWYRYNHDAYGETSNGGNYDGRTGVGRLWTLLSGERGEYELAAGDLKAAQTRLAAMAGFANESFMIPEQVWDLKRVPSDEFEFGEGTGSATPLAWSMAQFIRLAMNIRKGRNLETPKVVLDRYVNASRKAQGKAAKELCPDLNSAVLGDLCGSVVSFGFPSVLPQRHGEHRESQRNTFRLGHHSAKGSNGCFNFESSRLCVSCFGC